MLNEEISRDKDKVDITGKETVRQEPEEEEERCSYRERSLQTKNTQGSLSRVIKLVYCVCVLSTAIVFRIGCVGWW